MLAAATLDNTERLLALSPYLAAPPAWTLMHLEAAAGSKYATGVNLAAIHNEVLGIFLFQGSNTGNPLYRMVPTDYASGAAAAVVQDSALQIHQLAVEQGTGRVWGVVNNSSGNDGLYRRDASVTAPNWTKVISAANGATLTIWRKPNGDLWYHDATAGNWYLLSAGAAGSAQTTQPAGLAAWNGGAGEGLYDIDGITSGPGSSLLSCAAGSASVVSSATGYSAEAAVGTTSAAAIFEASAAPSAATLRARVPWELVAHSRFADQVSSQGWYAKTVRLNATYSLIVAGNSIADQTDLVWNGSAYVRYRSGDPTTRARLSLALLNKTSWACRYLGTVAVPTVADGVAYPAANDVAVSPRLLSARLLDGQLDLVLGGTLANNGGTALAGLLWGSVPLTRLDI